LIEIFYGVAIVETFAPLIPILIYWRTRKYQEPQMMFLVVILGVSMIADIIGMTSTLWLKLPNLNRGATNLYSVVNIICMTQFYKAIFPWKYRNAFLGLMILLLLIYLYFFLSSSNLGTHDRKIPESIAFTVVALSYFYRLMKEMPSTHIQSLPMFWINAGFLIYYAATIVLFAVSDYLVEVLKDNLAVYWIFHNLLNILKYILLAIGLWQVTPRTRSL
jgi:hypothetical protein